MRTLEEDILLVYYTAWQPLSVEDVWERLSDEGICVPILYLAKVIRILVASGYLQASHEVRGTVYYKPSRFFARLWALLSGRISISVTRRAVKVKQSSKIQIKGLLLLGAVLMVLPAYSEQPPSDLEPVELQLSQSQPFEALPDNIQGTETTTVPITVPQISTSRPSFTDAVITVPQGSLQFENGATYTRYSHGVNQWGLPETLVRLGLTPNTELRYTTPNYAYLGGHGNTAINTFGDMSVGMGHHVDLPGGVGMAIWPSLNLPTGANVASSNAVDPEVRVVLAKSPTPKIQLSSMVSSRWTNSHSAPQDAVLTATAIGYYSFTEQTNGFFEYATFIPVGPGNGGSASNTHYLQTGLIHAFKKRHQVDIRAAIGLNRAAPDFLVGVGYSFRLDGLFGESKAYASLK